MNERIKELAEQALKSSMVHDGVYHPDGYANSVSKVFADTFAELIVRECLTFVEPMPGSGDIDDLALEAARDQIKEHFGVKE